MKKIATVSLIGMLMLSGCATDPGVSNKVNAVAAGLMLAEQTWVRTCTDVPTLSICVDPLKTQIKALDKRAYDAVEMAKKNEALISLAISAVGDFTTATARR